MSRFASTMFEENENFTNWLKINSTDAVVAKKRFFARKIHKLTKILKFGTKTLAKKFSFEERQNAKNDRLEEIRQNEENERLESKFVASNRNRKMDECETDNALNENSENWDNWDACYMCAGNGGQYLQNTNQQRTIDEHRRRELSQTTSSKCWAVRQTTCENSICYVFMPGKVEPIPVKLRTARIPGGVMWITYRPDVDIPSTENLYSNTVSQIAQAQRPIIV